MKRSTSRWTISLLTVLLLGSFGEADEVKFNGILIEGKVTNITSAGVEFETAYGKLLVPFADIEAVTTDAPLYVIHGESGETFGRVLGVEDDKLLVGDEPATAERIDVTTILEIDTQEELEGWLGTAERLRNYFRYWKASFNAGFSYSDKTTDEVNFNLGFRIERRKEPTRLVATVDYIFGREKSPATPTKKTDNELLGHVKGEYDLSDRFFLVTAHSAEYDELDRISLRWIGAGGIGYRVLKSDTAGLQVETGGGYVWRRSFGGDIEQYPTIPFGLEGFYQIPDGPLLEYATSYQPSLDHWVDEYLIVSRASLSFPLYSYLALTMSIRNTYDNRPDPGSQRNEFRTLIALSWQF